MEAVLKDKRFAHVAKDPRFRRMPHGERKVKIDKRFKAMFKDQRFKLKYSVDKRGKPINLSTNENLKKYYELDSDSQDDDGEEAEDDRVADSSDLDENNSSSVSEDEKSSSENKELLSVKCKTEKKLDSTKHKANTLKNEGDKTETKQNKPIKDKHHSSKSDKNKGKKKKHIGSASEDDIMPGGKMVDSDNENNCIVTLRHCVNLIKRDQKLAIDEAVVTSLSAVANNTESDSKVEDDIKKALQSGIDIARGVGNVESSSSEDEDEVEEGTKLKQKVKDDEKSSSEDEEVEETEDIDHRWGELDDNVTEMEEATRRLAVCNMDWDRIKARDIFVLLNSFKPANGLVKDVKIYLSEFGKERLEEDKAHGPRELKELKRVEGVQVEDDDAVDKDGNAYNTEKLRKYQLNRLKYYYAVAEFDSEETSDHVYKECDGMEYETSCNKLDLRFIPDDVEFDEEPVSQCTEMPVSYEPMFFTNSALSQSKVDLTWDETDIDRVALTQKQFAGKADDINEDDIKAYLASSSDEEGPDYEALIGKQSDSDGEEEEEEPTEEKQIDRYRKLLQDIDTEQTKKREEDTEMEITWEVGLKSATKDLVKKKKTSNEATPWEEYLEKKKDKKKKKREDKKKIVDSAEEEEEEADPVEGGAAFSDDDLPEGVDTNDPFFSKNTEGSGKQKKAKKKKKQKGKEVEETEEDVKEKEALSLLTMDDETDKKHFNMKKLVEDDGKKKKKNKKGEKGQKTRKKKDEDGFELNTEDPRFSAIFKSHLYNIDPSAPEYKKTKGTEALLAEKVRRGDKNDGSKKRLKGDHCETSIDTEAKKLKIDTDSLASLVNSVKAKTKQFQNKKARK